MTRVLVVGYGVIGQRLAEGVELGVLCSAESTTIGWAGEPLEFDVKHDAVPTSVAGIQRKHCGRTPLDM